MIKNMIHHLKQQAQNALQKTDISLKRFQITKQKAALVIPSTHFVINASVCARYATVCIHVENMNHFICIGYFQSARQPNKKAWSLEDKKPCIPLHVECPVKMFPQHF